MTSEDGSSPSPVDGPDAPVTPPAAESSLRRDFLHMGLYFGCAFLLLFLGLVGLS
jgi:hypothetical protein